MFASCLLLQVAVSKLRMYLLFAPSRLRWSYAREGTARGDLPELYFVVAPIYASDDLLPKEAVVTLLTPQVPGVRRTTHGRSTQI